MSARWAVLLLGGVIWVGIPSISLAKEVDLGRIEISPSRVEVLDNRSFLSWTVWQGICPYGDDVASLLQGLSQLSLDVGRGSEGVVSLAVDGFSPRQSLIMVDGIPLNSIASGQFNINRLPSSAMQEVRLLPGSMSYLWDSGLGGVVNFSLGVDRPGVEVYGQRFGGWGSSLALKGGCWEGLVELGQAYQDIDWKDRDWEKGFFKLRGEEWALFSLFYSGEINSGVFPDDSWERDRYNGVAVSLRHHLQIDGWEGQLRWVFLSDSTKVENFLSPESKVPYQRIWTKFYRSGLWVDASRWLTEDLFLFAGGDVEGYKLFSYYLSRHRGTGKVHGFINLSWYTGDESFWIIGAACSYTPAYGTSLSGQVMFNWGGFHIGVSRAVSSPPLLWRYYDESISGVAGNPDIEQERSWRLDVDQKWDLGWSSVRLFGAVSWIENAIGVDRIGSSYVMRNYKEFKEEKIGLQWNGVWGTIDWQAFVDLHRLYDRENHCERRGVIKDREGILLRVELGRGIFWAMKIWRQDLLMNPLYQTRDGKVIVDLDLVKEFKFGKIFLRINNLFESDFWQDEYYPVDKGRWEIGLKIHW